MSDLLLNLFRSGRPKAIVFDVDGTLYLQRPLQRAMVLRLMALCAARPVHGWTTLRVLREYRRAQETLRARSVPDVESAQLALACERTGVDRDRVAECVGRWMHDEPVKVMARFAHPGALDLLQACRANGVRLAALSDYPAEKKLEALGIGRLFDAVLCAQSADVDVFKPNPRGLLLAMKRLGVTGKETLYVGDRVDVDAATAAAAGVRCAIVGSGRSGSDTEAYVRLQSHVQLHRALWPA